MSASAWRLASASVVGDAHVRAGEGKQDCLFVCDSGSSSLPLIVLVADGAGSAEHGALGSRTVIEVVSEGLLLHLDRHGLEKLTRTAVRHLLEEARVVVGEAAVRKNTSVREFASTLVGAVVGEAGAVFFQVGDGAVVVGPPWQPVFWPERGEYANSTCFVIDDDVDDHLQFATRAPVESLAVFSDGVQGLALDERNHSAHAPFFDGVFAGLQADGDLNAELARWLRSPRVAARSDDDKTLVLARRLR